MLDAQSLQRLPGDDRSAWQALWADVDAFLTKAAPAREVRKSP
jgi:hypothetical protein